MAKRKKKNEPTLAELADRHVLYQKSVQATDFEIEFYEDRYREIRGKRKKPTLLREDFCGTAMLAADWCISNTKRRAIGVDLCSDTLRWGLENNIKPAGASVEKRITLLNDNVLTVVSEKADILCAMNFSYCIFETRDLLREYFVNARNGLKEDGLLFLDLLGGTGTIDVTEEEKEIEIDGQQATYVWEQATFNPIDNHMQCYIHFNFEDGSRLEKAFTYAWRLWSIPEIKELLLEAGFSKVHIYWEEFVEGDDPDDEYLEGTGNYRAVTEIDQQESWLAYFAVEY